jgi:hypothetical protein
LRGGLNTYLYVEGNPLKYIDPYGLDNYFIEGSLGIGYKTNPNEGYGGKVSGGIFINIGDGNGNLITNDGKGNINSYTLHLDAGIYGSPERLEVGGGASAGIYVGCIAGDRHSFEEATTNINAPIFPGVSTTQMFKYGTEVDLLSGKTDFTDNHVGQSYGIGYGGEFSKTTQITNSLSIGDAVRNIGNFFNFLSGN